MTLRCLHWAATARAVGGVACFVVLALAGCTQVTPHPSAIRATVVVATADSAPASRALAQFVGDGDGDQAEINEAIRSLPAAGGTVQLMEGTYDIRRVPGEFGGVLIRRGSVTLAGQGPATRLVQARGQETNVIRIGGTGVGNVVVRDLAVDAARDANPRGGGDPQVPHSRFEFCGIKAYSGVPGRDDLPCHDITVRNVRVENARALGVMLVGRNVRVVDCYLGNASSDSVELLMGPGEVRGNYVEITGRTQVAIGSDRGDSIVMAGNIVHVREGGDLDIAFRTWQGSRQHTIAGNQVRVDPGGRCGAAMDIRGTATAVTGNVVEGPERGAPLALRISGGATVVTANSFGNVAIEVNDTSRAPRPIIVRGNVMERCVVRRLAGSLQTD